MFMFIRLFMIILAIIGTSYILPVTSALYFGEYETILNFLIPMLVSWFFGVTFYLAGRKKKIDLSTRGVFLFVSLAWILISVFGALPFVLGGYCSFTDAFFESCSGFSTTGCTIFTAIESLPKTINLWRCETHWLGGMGIIALTTAILPLLGVGGFQLVKAESTGPEKGKITPKMANTAKALWLLYFALTTIQFIILMICFYLDKNCSVYEESFGVKVYQAMSHAFSTLGTGGFSTFNDSVAGFKSLPVEIICTIFMFLAGINFSMYFYLVTGKFKEIKNNSELKAYSLVFVIIVVCLTVSLVAHYNSLSEALRHSSFQVASIMSTTGFGTTSETFTSWPSISQFFIFILFFIGGSSGSTSGGFKVIRWVVLSKQFKVEIQRMLHPHGVYTVRIDGEPGRKDLVLNIAAFIFIYVILVALTTAIGCIAELDLMESFTGSLSMLGSIGPAWGRFSSNGAFLPDYVKLWYCFAMIAGRLELYNLIIFFTKDFWKK